MVTAIAASDIRKINKMKPILTVIYVVLFATSCSSMDSKQKMKVNTKVDSASVSGEYFNIQGFIINNTKNTIIINSKNYSYRYKITGAVISDSSDKVKPIMAFGGSKVSGRSSTDKVHRLEPKDSVPFTCKIPISIEYNSVEISWLYYKLDDSQYYRTDRVSIKY